MGAVRSAISWLATGGALPYYGTVRGRLGRPSIARVGMIFQIEGKPALNEPSAIRLRLALKSLRSYGPSSYASLTDDKGNYIQGAGGDVTCMVERYEKETDKRER